MPVSSEVWPYTSSTLSGSSVVAVERYGATIGAISRYAWRMRAVAWRARNSSSLAPMIRPRVASPTNRSRASTATTTPRNSGPPPDPWYTKPSATSEADSRVRNMPPRVNISL